MCVYNRYIYAASTEWSSRRGPKVRRGGGIDFSHSHTGAAPARTHLRTMGPAVLTGARRAEGTYYIIILTRRTRVTLYMFCIILLYVYRYNNGFLTRQVFL